MAVFKSVFYLVRTILLLEISMFIILFRMTVCFGLGMTLVLRCEVKSFELSGNKFNHFFDP